MVRRRCYKLWDISPVRFYKSPLNPRVKARLTGKAVGGGGGSLIQLLVLTVSPVVLLPEWECVLVRTGQGDLSARYSEREVGSLITDHTVTG